MTWREELRRVALPDGRQLIGASFRGVPFFVEASERAGGRRTMTHEFPQRDDPFIEDLGRKARVFRVEGYVVGDDYLADKNALLTALEDTAGAGELVHPYYGVFRAVCDDIVVREQRLQGGIALFQLVFVQTADTPPAPIEAPDLGEEVGVAADDALEAVDVEFLETYDVAGQPSFALDSLVAEFNAMRNKLGEELAPIAATTQEAAKLNATIQVLGLVAASLVRQPAQLVQAFVSTLRDLADTATAAPRGVLGALLNVYEAVGLVPPALGTTATRVRERANQEALVAALRRVLVVDDAGLGAAVTYETLEDAEADGSEIADLLEQQAGAASNATYPTLVLLRARVRRAVPGDALLARIVTTERDVALPSLLVSYQLYGSVAQEADILARNRIRHPGFVVGALQVLSDG